MKSDDRVPGDWLLHPVVLTAALVLGFNDHLFKGSVPGVLTGKLSDFAGLIFFPLFLLSLFEWAQWLIKRRVTLHPRIFLLGILSTAAVFSVINLDHQAGALYRSAVQGVWKSLGLTLGSVHHTVDPTDLLALVSLWVPLSLFRKRQRLEAAGDLSLEQFPWKVPV